MNGWDGQPVDQSILMLTAIHVLSFRTWRFISIYCLIIGLGVVNEIIQPNFSSKVQEYIVTVLQCTTQSFNLAHATTFDGKQLQITNFSGIYE